MIVKIEWLNNGGLKGSMTVDISKFFPTTKTRAKKLFKIMTMDICGTDFKPVRDWLEEQWESALIDARGLKAMVDVFKDEWFENNLWYGDCVANEKKYKYMQKEIAKKEKDIEQYQSYIDSFDKILRL